MPATLEPVVPGKWIDDRELVGLVVAMESQKVLGSVHVGLAVLVGVPGSSLDLLVGEGESDIEFMGASAPGLGQQGTELLLNCRTPDSEVVGDPGPRHLASPGLGDQLLQKQVDLMRGGFDRPDRGEKVLLVGRSIR